MYRDFIKTDSLMLKEIFWEMIFALHERLNSATLQASLRTRSDIGFNSNLYRVCRSFYVRGITPYRLVYTLILAFIILIFIMIHEC
jgi:hypothetical protein